MTNAERQRRWRERHKGYAQLKERNYKRRVRGREEPVTDTPVPNIRPKVHNAIPGYGDDLVRVSMDEVEGDPNVMREHREMMERRMNRTPVVAPARKGPEEKVVSERELKAVQDLAAIVGRRKASREVEVPWE